MRARLLAVRVGDSTRRAILLTALGLGLALRLIYQAHLLADPTYGFPHGNAAGFVRRAREVMAGDLLLRGEVFFYGPLYPYFLAACWSLAGGETLVVPRLVQALLGVAMGWAIYRIARRAFDPASALAAAWIALFYWPGYFFEGLLLADQMATVLLVLGVDLLLSGVAAPAPRRRLLLPAAGFAFALSAWGRGNTLLLVPLVVLWPLLEPREPTASGDDRHRSRQEAWGAALLVALGVALALLPPALRNGVVEGDWSPVLSHAGGINFFIGNNPEAIGVIQLPFAAGISTDADNAFYRNTEAVAEAAVGHPLLPAEVSRYWFRRGLDWMRQHPLDAVRLTGRKVRLLLDPYEIPIHSNAQYFRSSSWVLSRLPMVGWAALLPLAVAGIVLARPGRDQRGFLLLLACAYAASVVPFFVADRVRFPLAMLLTPFAGHAVARAGAAGVELAHRRRPDLAGRLAVAALVGVVAWALIAGLLPGLPSPVSPEWRARYLAFELYRHGQARERLGDRSAALADYDRAVATHPGHVPSRLAQARLLAALGRPAEARRILAAVLEAAPDNAEARRLLGSLASP